MTRRRPVPVDAGLPHWLFGNHPIGLASVAATILLASLLFLDAPLNQLGASLLPERRHLFRDVTSLGNSGWKISLSLAMVLMFAWLRPVPSGKGRPCCIVTRLGLPVSCWPLSRLPVSPPAC